VGWSGVEWSGVEWSGVEWGGVEWSGVEWGGVGWSGVEWGGVGGGALAHVRVPLLMRIVVRPGATTSRLPGVVHREGSHFQGCW
jgi:hypothetical protein